MARKESKKNEQGQNKIKATSVRSEHERETAQTKAGSSSTKSTANWTRLVFVRSNEQTARWGAALDRPTGRRRTKNKKNRKKESTWRTAQPIFIFGVLTRDGRQKVQQQTRIGRQRMGWTLSTGREHTRTIMEIKRVVNGWVVLYGRRKIDRQE